jgi:hypothetical protein
VTASDHAAIADRKVTASIVVAAPPAEVFASLANPHRHHEWSKSDHAEHRVLRIVRAQRRSKGDTMTTSPAESDRPGGDLTDHGADPVDRERDDDGATTAAAPDTDGQDVPAGDLTDHGVDPAGRAAEE